MKLTKQNVKELPVSEYERGLVSALIDDLEEINLNGPINRDLYLDYQDYHNEYSPERTDPCPDYYGYYTVRSAADPTEILGIEMTVEDLDLALCLLYNYAVDE